MLVLIFGFSAALTLLVIGTIHFYWAFGGKWGLGATFPKTREDEEIKIPGILPTLIVAFGLLAMALLFLVRLDFFSLALPDWILNYGLWVIGGIFFLRAVGEFKYVGIFKKIKNSEFAKMDSKLYIPLCLFLSAAAFIVQWNA